MTSRTSLVSTLPSFPWDSLASARAKAEQHPDGIVDLSVGTPVDETPRAAQEALAAASDAHGYPTVAGTGELREAIVDFCRAHRGAPRALEVSGVLPTIGSKELVAHLPFQLGIGVGEAVAFPHIAYPTYDLGARLAGARPVPLDVRALAREGEGALGSDVCLDSVRLLWLNTPSNPTGAVLSVEEMRTLVAWARERDIIVASDECYAPLTWDVEEAPSILDERVNNGDLTGMLCAYSLSKQSNLAGYRAAFVAGDPALVGELLAVRKHSGLMMPGPIQKAMTAALGEEASASHQRETYRARRESLAPALEAFGGRIEHSEAGLYLWTTFGESSNASIERLAELGILAAPGTFYGEAGARHVRVSLTASDERIDSAAARLRAAR
ncbi:succinyldiaminopimelate transaminase [Dermabacter sp. HSID17554]|uniref:succinyldiaminopimelate transaminase n=1 Tax=Dermabacter sp. HSID17554 TaxID=2419511 RepID=UPI000F867EE2|nr:succinyldiaminopimelate transaminase [Dermabacter sp. HSID17554]RUP86098.1 succinyldiaminopimelate transaminase [Dermabacter sp. HSID17554]